MKLIVGLGNPGRNYRYTRHNVGFDVVDLLALKYDLSFNENDKFFAFECSFNLNGEKVIIIKPLTYMNLSGSCISLYIDYYNLELSDILVIQDDLDMSLGKIRFVFDSSSGGHNGIKDIIYKLGSQRFSRLKIGISNDKGINTKDYVLGRFSGYESRVLKESYKKLYNLIEDFILYDVDKLKQIYNSKNN